MVSVFLLGELNVDTVTSIILDGVTVRPVKGQPVLSLFRSQPAFYGQFSLIWGMIVDHGLMRWDTPCKRTLESGNIVRGGGIIQTALSIHIENSVTI